MTYFSGSRNFAKLAEVRKKVIPVWNSLIENSFLDNKMQSAYKQLILEKFRQINLMD